MKKHKYILLIIGILLIVFLLIIYFNNQQNHHQDIKNIRIHEETKKILQSLDDKVYINIYLNGNLSPQCLKLQDSLILLLNNFNSYTNKEIDWSFVEIEEKEDEDGKIYSPLIGQDIYPIFIKDKGKSFKIYPYATVQYKEKKSLPIVLLPPSLTSTMSMRNDIINELSEENLQEAVNELEYNLIEAIYLLKQNKTKKIAFLQSCSGLQPVYTADIYNTLSKYYEIDYIDLNPKTILENNTLYEDHINKQIQKLNSYNALVIAKPRKVFNDNDLYIIDQYIMNGGRTLWLLEGTKKLELEEIITKDYKGRNIKLELNYTGHEFTITKDSSNLKISTLLSNYGAKVNNDLIQDEICTKNMIFENETYLVKKWQYNPLLISDGNHLIGSYGDSILSHFVSSIKILKPDRTTILLSSSERSNTLKEGEKVRRNIINNPEKTFTGRKTISVLLEDEFTSAYSSYNTSFKRKIKKRSKKNKIIIISDGDIIKNLYDPENKKILPLGWDPYKKSKTKNNHYIGNTQFILNSILYLCEDEALIKIRNKIK